MHPDTRALLFGFLTLGGIATMVLFTWIIVAPPSREAPIAPPVKIEKQPDLGPPRGDTVKAVLTDAPQVPPATGRHEPTKVVVELEVKEVTLPIADGASYTFWTFGGHVPGKFIRIRHGDTVEFHLRNAPDSKLPHNIDLHAVSGPGGGAEGSYTAPGHESRFTFKALNQGLYVYHCATAPVGLHVANGMYGLILVEPQEGLAPVDHEFYVMQGDFYTSGTYREKGDQAFNQERAIDENPTYVVFNGADGSLVGKNALHAKVGEKIRLFLGNGGPNLPSNFHVIGEIFDRVYTEGGSRYQENVQTTVIPPGGSAIAEFTVNTPGTYALVDHALFRAFNKGAVGQLVVEGEPQKDIYTSKESDTLWNGTAAAAVSPTIEVPQVINKEPEQQQAQAQQQHQAAPKVEEKAEPAKKLTLAEQMQGGQQTFNTICAACHRATGEGMPGMFPPLAKSDFLMADKKRAIGIVVNGLSGQVTVNGNNFNSMMPPLGGQLSDEQIANVLTYVRNSFGNKGEAVKTEEVKAVRGGGAGASK